jgi:uncharacterized protein YyaL (SSP411 family)
MLPGKFDTVYRRLGNEIFQKTFWVVRVECVEIPEIYHNILFSITLTSDGPLTVCFRGLGDLTFYVENIFETEKEAQKQYETELSCKISNMFEEKRNHLESADQIQDQVRRLNELLEDSKKK